MKKKVDTEFFFGTIGGLFFKIYSYKDYTFDEFVESNSRLDFFCHFRSSDLAAYKHVIRLKAAHVAQLAEHVLGKDEVISSILIVGSSKIKRYS